MLEFNPQCCDAVQYLQLGEACYRTGDCYHALRPIADQLWFSLPFRLGLPPESLIILHGLLWLVSVGLSAFALAEWVHRALPVTHRVRWLSLVLLGFSAVVHGVFFYPVMFVSLVDAPAGLCALIGVWLLLLSSRFPSAWVFACAGLSLGAALWLRLAYVYPVLLALVCYGALWLWRANRQWREWWLLLALVPVLLQCMATYQRYGEFAMINTKEAHFWRDFHLNGAAVGYDTLWPGQGYRWGFPCLLGYGVAEAIRRGEPLSVMCLMLDRIGFFFGSYSARTYPFYGQPSLLDDAVSESVGRPGTWQGDGIRWEADVGESPYRTPTVDALYGEPGHPVYRVSYKVFLQADSRYTFSLWLGSPSISSARLLVVRDADSAVMGQRQVDLAESLERRQLWVLTKGAGDYRLVLEWGADTAGRHAPLYAWGAKLETGKQMTGYKAPGDRRLLRVWSDGLYGFSWLMLLLSIGLVVHLRQQLHRGALTSMVLVAAVFGESLIVIPEQRYGVVFMTVFWLCPFALMLFWFERIWFRHKPRMQV